MSKYKVKFTCINLKYYEYYTNAHKYFIRASEKLLNDLEQSGNFGCISRIRPETVGD